MLKIELGLMDNNIAKLIAAMMGTYLVMELILDPEMKKDIAALNRIKRRGYIQSGINVFTHELEDGKIILILWQ